jgi:hypothetical protein
VKYFYELTLYTNSFVFSSPFFKKNIKKATYALWHPKGYKYYKTNLNKLSDKYPDIAPFFPRSIMPSVSFNLGNHVTTKKHADSQN